MVTDWICTTFVAISISDNQVDSVKPNPEQMYLISSCLVGINCRYNGTSTNIANLKKMVETGKAIALCPEVMVGLPTPRESCEIKKNPKKVVISESGVDFTEYFVKGAEETLRICREKNITKAILQSRSPSCGYGKIYDGNFRGKLVKGNGITADLLNKNGIEITTEDEWLNK